VTRVTRWLWIAAAIVLGIASIVLVASCGGGDDESSEGGTTTVGDVSANDHGAKDVSGESKVEVELDDDYFEPTVLEGTPGQRITLELKNEGGSEHNLTIGELMIDQDVEPGDEAEVEVTFPDSGTLTFFCKYHRGQGMAGAFRVAS
jgi:plastocyanin